MGNKKYNSRVTGRLINKKRPLVKLEWPFFVIALNFLHKLHHYEKSN